MALREFTIFRKSSNTNSFGLRGYWAVCPLGQIYSFANSNQNLYIGQVIKCEAPRQLGELVRLELLIHPSEVQEVIDVARNATHPPKPKAKRKYVRKLAKPAQPAQPVQFTLSTPSETFATVH